MDFLDLIFFLLPILFFIALPGILFFQRKKELKKRNNTNRRQGPNDGWSINGSREENNNPAAGKKASISFPRLSDDEIAGKTVMGRPKELPADSNLNYPLDHIDSLPRFKQAVIWKEILGKPRSLRDWDY